MNIAFVAYPVAALLPPYHGSMGASIYTIAREFAQHSNVVVYGLAGRQAGAPSGMYEGVEYRFVPAAASDDRRARMRNFQAKLVQFSAPVSTSAAFYPKFGEQVAADLATQQWDVIHVQHCAQFVPIIRKLNPKAKIVLHIHAEWFSQSNFSEIARRIRGVDALLTVSDFVTKRTQRNFPLVADRCETLYNGIDINEFDREKDYAPAARRKTRRILYAGGLWPHKGAHVAMDAFKLVAEKYPDVVFDLVGPEGDYPLEEACDLQDQATLSRMAPYFRKRPLHVLTSKLLGKPAGSSSEYISFLKGKLSPELSRKVTFHGFVSRGELVQLYYDADMFLYPPIWNEAFGLTPLEAMAAGVPVVVSRCGGIVETVQDGKTGFVVEPDNPVALADALLRLAEDNTLRETMGRAGRARALEFTWHAVTNSMQLRYEQLAGAGVRESRSWPSGVGLTQPVTVARTL